MRVGQQLRDRHALARVGRIVLHDHLEADLAPAHLHAAGIELLDRQQQAVAVVGAVGGLAARERAGEADLHHVLGLRRQRQAQTERQGQRREPQAGESSASFQGSSQKTENKAR